MVQRVAGGLAQHGEFQMQLGGAVLVVDPTSSPSSKKTCLSIGIEDSLRLGKAAETHRP